MSIAVQNAYDEVPYAGYPFPQTHPDRMVTMATLFGLNPAPVTNCRVLEIGCGEGANLIPMACELPESYFIGIDLAACPIAQGQAMAAAVGLRNIELHQCDLMKVGAEFGQFDYIIAHGVYSWVPPEVQNGLLALCEKLLAPQGIAYISYNVYPGCHLREMVREMMLFHTRGMQQPCERVNQGLALLDFILRRFPSQAEAQTDLYGALIKEQLDLMLSHSPEQVYHDELAPHYRPVYFYQFIMQAAQYGLQYLGEADLFEMQDLSYPPPVRETLSQFGDEHIVQKEQYLDFLKGRSFRQTLLCREGLKLTRRVQPEQLRSFYLASSVQPVSPQPDLRDQVIEEFRGPKGAKLQTDYPLAKAALVHLSEVFPRRLRFEQLLAAARARLGLSSLASAFDEEAQVLAEILLAACWSGLVQLHSYVPPLVAEVSQRPLASPLARWQASRGKVVTNLLHSSVELGDELSRQLLQLLDGTHDRAALRDELLSAVTCSGISKRPDSGTAGDEQQMRNLITDAIEANLQKLMRLALLMG
jgi:methyltransferase-like protein/ubiquinone/menaquinone biosynthesis C-methylase UbiE